MINFSVTDNQNWLDNYACAFCLQWTSLVALTHFGEGGGGGNYYWNIHSWTNQTNQIYFIEQRSKCLMSVSLVAVNSKRYMWS